LLLERSTADLQLLICDAKRVIFQAFKDCAHLIAPIMSQPDEAIAYLEKTVDEMEKRYQMFERLAVENIDAFNIRSSEKLPRIVFLFDEFGDLWDCCTKLQVDKLENLIIRLGQKARAAGIHLIIFTQRPKKVVSPRLRSNCPARVLLTVADSADSEAILGNKSFDGSQLLGRGDLFFNADRLQALLSDESDFAKLSGGQSQLTAIDKLTQVDELTSIDSHLSPLNSQSSARQLSKPLQSIFDYAKRQDSFVTASQVKANVRLFRDTSVTEIRNYFQWLADNSYGITRGGDDNLEFSAN
jgi:DNA segregation ATPase FtsK/SpoIIIE-like protein